MLNILLTAVYMQKKKKKNNFGNTDEIFAQFLLAAGETNFCTHLELSWISSL